LVRNELRRKRKKNLGSVYMSKKKFVVERENSVRVWATERINNGFFQPWVVFMGLPPIEVILFPGNEKKSQKTQAKTPTKGL